MTPTDSYFTADGDIAREGTLCWYCGQYRMKVVPGRSIGEMVYSSHIHNSRELADGTVQDCQDHHDAAMKSTCVMCYECLQSYAFEIGALDSEYVEHHLANNESQNCEVVDSDTHLLPLQEKKFPFGCWLYQYPDIDVRKKFWSLSLAELYIRGFRLAGEVWFGNWEADQLLTKFAATGESVAVPEGFIEHVAATIHVDDSSFPGRLARLRAVAFDVSIMEATGDHLSQ